MVEPAHIRNLCDEIHDVLHLSQQPPAPKGGQGGGASGSRPPMPTAILDAKLDLKQKLTSWALMLGEDENIVINCDDDSLSIAGWIYTKADTLAAHPAAEDFVTEIREAVDALRRPYLPRQNLEYLGEHCGEHVRIRPGQATVTLADGTVEQAETLRRRTRHMMLNVIGPPALIADVVSVYFGRKLKAQQITTAHSDDHNPNRTARHEPLEAVTIDGRRKTFRVCDVLERFGVPYGANEDSAVS